MVGECVSVPAGGQVHNKHYCVGCGLLLGYVTREEALDWYADGHGTAAPGSKEEYFSRLAGWGR